MSRLRTLSLSALVFGCCAFPALGTPGEPLPDLVAQGARRPAVSSTTKMSPPAQFQRLQKSVELARQIKSGSGGQVGEVEQIVQSVLGELDSYPNLSRVHGHEEPEWLSDRQPA